MKFNLFAYRNLIRFFAFFLAISTSGCLTMGGSSAKLVKKSEAVPHEVEIFYATNRAHTKNIRKVYGSERGNLGFGTAQVAIPPGHIMGRHEGPSLLKFQWSPDEHKHIKLRGVTPMEDEDFIQKLAQAVDTSPSGKLMIFVHGYNVDFEEGARVLAQFANDLKFSGPVLMFSWPSRGNLTGYAVDSTNSEWATADFVRMLNKVLDRVPAKDIYLIAHSMGNRIAARGVTTVISDRFAEEMGLFRELIMVAPDIDADVFRHDLAPRLKNTGIHVTLYASSKDRALMASKAFNGYPRAGDAGDGLVIVDGVETIDASGNSSGLLGHSYFAEDRTVMEDIFGLLKTGNRADDRFGLAAVEKEGQRYWVFRK